MKLFITKGSPFARKARILAREKGLSGRMEEVVIAVSPVEPRHDLAAHNPLSKLPVLLLDDGTSLYDSSVICAYLDTLHGGTRALPDAGWPRISALRREALADGMLEAAILCRYELALRPEPLRWVEWVQGQQRKVFAGLAELEAEVDGWGEDYALPQIAVTCALGYLDYRFADWQWRGGFPRLAAWFERIASRPSVVETIPS
ncbi:glutathione S-transferase family protein [Ramlibacter sp. AN1015]|uniref:glutathione S-transferase family protein n=1 Tax=Ramlibacter sp. AN1015 TaxID=3133428 RepID=UPI0030BD278A